MFIHKLLENALAM